MNSSRFIQTFLFFLISPICISPNVILANNLECQTYLSNLSFSNNLLKIKPFIGYKRDSGIISTFLGTPATWSYRKIGGYKEDTRPGEHILGSASNVYRAETENGHFLILKEYYDKEILGYDLKTFKHLATVLKSQPKGFLVPNIKLSSTNSHVLFLDYFEGIDFESFMTQNPTHPLLPSLIELYNRNIQHLSALLNNKVRDSNRPVSHTKIEPLMWNQGNDFFIYIKPANVLLLNPLPGTSEFRFVIIDPE